MYIIVFLFLFLFELFSVMGIFCLEFFVDSFARSSFFARLKFRSDLKFLCFIFCCIIVC